MDERINAFKEAYNDSEIDEEDIVVLTPKGIAAWDLLVLGMVDGLDDPKIDAFWTLFEEGMRKKGYITERG